MFSCVLENTMKNQWPLMTSDGKDWMRPMVAETSGGGGQQLAEVGNRRLGTLVGRGGRVANSEG